MTPIDLYEKTLEHLQVTAAGESAAPEDTAVVRQRYQSLYAMLDVESLVEWGVTEDIPSYAEQPLIMMLAAYSAQEFGVTDPRYSQLQIEGGLSLPQPSLAERLLRRQMSNKYIPTVQATEYF